MNDHNDINELERLISQSIQSPSSAMTPLFGSSYIPSSAGTSHESSLRQLSSMRSARLLKDAQNKDVLVLALKDRIDVLERECELSNQMLRRGDERSQHLAAAQLALSEENKMLSNKLAMAMKQVEDRGSELESERIRGDRLHSMNIELIDEVSLLKLVNSRLAHSSNNVLLQQQQDADHIKLEARSILSKQDDYIRQLKSDIDRLNGEHAASTARAEDQRKLWLQEKHQLLSEIELLRQEIASLCKAHNSPNNDHEQTILELKATADRSLAFLCDMAERIVKITHNLNDVRDSSLIEHLFSVEASTSTPLLQMEAFLVEQIALIESALSSMRERLADQDAAMAKSFRTVEKSTRTLSKAELKISSLSLQLAEYDELVSRLLADLEYIHSLKSESAIADSSILSDSSFISMNASAVNIRPDPDAEGSHRATKVNRAKVLMAQLKGQHLIHSNRLSEQESQLRAALADNDALQSKLSVYKARLRDFQAKHVDADGDASNSPSHRIVSPDSSSRKADFTQARREELLRWCVAQMAAFVRDLLLQKQVHRAYEKSLRGLYRDIDRLAADYDAISARAQPVDALLDSSSISSHRVLETSGLSQTISASKLSLYKSRHLRFRVVAIAVRCICRMRVSARGAAIRSTLRLMIQHSDMHSMSSALQTCNSDAAALAAVCELLRFDRELACDSAMPAVASMTLLDDQAPLHRLEQAMSRQTKLLRDKQDLLFSQMTTIDALKVEVMMKTRIAEDWRDQVIALQQQIDMLAYHGSNHPSIRDHSSSSLSRLSHSKDKDKDASFAAASPESYKALLSASRSFDLMAAGGAVSLSSAPESSSIDVSSPVDYMLAKHRSLNATAAMNASYPTFHTAADAHSPMRSQQDFSVIADSDHENSSSSSSNQRILFRAHGSPEKSDDFTKLFREVNAATRWSHSHDTRYHSFG